VPVESSGLSIKNCQLPEMLPPACGPVELPELPPHAESISVPASAKIDTHFQLSRQFLRKEAPRSVRICIGSLANLCIAIPYPEKVLKVLKCWNHFPVTAPVVVPLMGTLNTVSLSALVGLVRVNDAVRFDGHCAPAVQLDACGVNSMLTVQDFPMSSRKVDPIALPAGSQVSPETTKLPAPLLSTNVHVSPVSWAVADMFVSVTLCAAEVVPGAVAGKVSAAGISVNGC
jgi:hypothetical protein